MRLVDTHAHLAMLQHDPLETILQRATDQGIYRMITVSTDEPSWESNRNLALQSEMLYYSLGLHPHDAFRWTECAGNFLKLFSDGKVPPKCVAIGEMGLDFHYNLSERDVQLEVFESQLQLAKRFHLPIIIHCRDAFDELFSTIKKLGLGERGGVMHCFTGDAIRAQEAVDLGLHISFSGILTFKNAEPLREAAKIVPKSHLLVETDCPFLAPVPFRGKPNEPGFLPKTAEVLAAMRKEKVEEIANITTENAIKFFQLNP